MASFVIRTPERDKFKQYLNKFGIRWGIHYPIPVHIQPRYKNKGYGNTSLPNTKEWAKEVLSIPLHTKLTEENVSFITEKIHETDLL